MLCGSGSSCCAINSRSPCVSGHGLIRGWHGRTVCCPKTRSRRSPAVSPAVSPAISPAPVMRSWLADRMLIKIIWLIMRWLFGLTVLVCRGDPAKNAELLVLRHENAVLRRPAGRVRYEPADRAWFAALAQVLPRRRWFGVFPVTPATLLAWHRKLVARTYDTSTRRRAGRPPTVRSIARVAVRLARENPLWAIDGFTASWVKSPFSDRAQHPHPRLHLRARPADRAPDAAQSRPGRPGTAGARAP